MKQSQQFRSQFFLVSEVLYLMRWPDDRDNKTTMTPVHSAWCLGLGMRVPNSFQRNHWGGVFIYRGMASCHTYPVHKTRIIDYFWLKGRLITLLLHVFVTSKMRYRTREATYEDSEIFPRFVLEDGVRDFADRDFVI